MALKQSSGAMAYQAADLEPPAANGTRHRVYHVHAHRKTRVLICDDNRMFAEALRVILEAQGMVVSVSTPEAAVDAIGIEHPHLVLIDTYGETHLRAASMVRSIDPHVKVLAIGPRSDARLASTLVAAGLCGYLAKDATLQEFISSIRAVLEGHVVVAPCQGTESISPASPEDRHARLLIDQMTQREREVLGLLVEGLNGEAIATRLGVSPNTVRTHVQSILFKLQVHSRLEAAAFGVRYGFAPNQGRTRNGRHGHGMGDRLMQST